MCVIIMVIRKLDSIIKQYEGRSCAYIYESPSAHSTPSHPSDTENRNECRTITDNFNPEDDVRMILATQDIIDQRDEERKKELRAGKEKLRGLSVSISRLRSHI
jgi:hypothetical protein